ncbi:hypothetical protein D3C86_700200 [compost metagenome]
MPQFGVQRADEFFLCQTIPALPGLFIQVQHFTLIRQVFKVFTEHAHVRQFGVAVLFELIGIGAHGRRHRAQAIEHVRWRNQALVGGIENLLHHVAQVAEL